MSAVTCLNGVVPVEPYLMRTFTASEKLDIESLQVCTFPKQHDSVDPYSFTVGFNGTTVGVFTDIGEACPNLVYHFSQCHAAFLEANYDEAMLENGNYPLHLKRRIKSNKGHLSNIQALELFVRHKSPFLTHLILSHLSEHNNHPSIVAKLFSQNANGTCIEIASRYRETEVFFVKATSVGN
jgi:phosphoribosyl 1,2-cyclic phosphodiesterase